jgi:5-methylcytosine-specific restriction endonuclease McrA
VNKLGAAQCRSCSRVLPAGLIEVDHVVPLADGGYDTEANLQPLCKRCHTVKTSRENRARAKKAGGGTAEPLPR